MMKNLTLLVTALLPVCGCGKQDFTTSEESAKDLLLRRATKTSDVTFESWNGKLRGVDNDAILHFYAPPRVVLEERGYSVEHYEGSYELTSEGRVIVSLKRYRENWPVMVLRRDGSNLLLDREDGHTSWLPKDYPDPDPQVDGFWPFRALGEKEAQQAAP
jgi:hypothetical protein